ncbi:MAG: DUF6544 family protein [Deltaproteobacteria bacterium]
MIKIIWYIGALLGSIFILAIAAVLIADRRFDHKVKGEVQELLADQGQYHRSSVSEADLQEKPASVRTWLARAGITGKQYTGSVWLEHTGTMRTEPGKAWMPFAAEYYYTVDKPGFIWKARVQAAPLIHLSGRDMLYRGHGNMEIKLLSLIPVADARGKEIDQGSLLRYLAEIVWFPTAALSDHIIWEEIGADQARATITVGETSVSGIYTFGQHGMPARFEAQRYMSRDEGYSLEKWVAELYDYQEFNGFLVPGRVQVTWDLPEGEFNWFKATVNRIEYDIYE